MYTLSEIRTIFSNCANWEELENVCGCFLYLIAQGLVPEAQLSYISIQSQLRFRQIENL
jgi:hypothetical protein